MYHLPLGGSDGGNDHLDRFVGVTHSYQLRYPGRLWPTGFWNFQKKEENRNKTAFCRGGNPWQGPERVNDVIHKFLVWGVYIYICIRATIYQPFKVYWYTDRGDELPCIWKCREIADFGSKKFRFSRLANIGTGSIKDCNNAVDGEESEATIAARSGPKRHSNGQRVQYIG